MATSERQVHPGAENSDLRHLIARTEALVNGVLVSTAAMALEGAEWTATPEEAVRLAVQRAAEGARASVMLRPMELFDAAAAIHAAARARAPITVHVVDGVSRVPGAVIPGRDEMASALDLGAGVLATWSAQDAVDLTLAARRAAEDSETPWILVSNSSAAGAQLPEAALVAKFLGDSPRANARARGDGTAEKRAERSFASRAPFALTSAMRALGELTGRELNPVERYQTVDAEEVIVAVGEAFIPARAVAEALRREEKRRIGAIGLRALRPFFGAEIVRAAARARAIAVVEPLDVALAPSGPLAASLKAAFADALTWAAGFPGVGRIPPIVFAVFATLDGGVGERDVRAVVDELATGDRARRVMVFGSDSA